MAAKRDRCRIPSEQMQSREDLVGVATSDRARASGAQGLPARLGEGPALVWCLLLGKECHGNWGGKKYGNLEGLLITGRWDVSGFFPPGGFELASQGSRCHSRDQQWDPRK